MVTELFDFAENLVDVAGILTDQLPLQGQRVVHAGAVPHFAVARDALVGVDADQGQTHGQPGWQLTLVMRRSGWT